MQGSCKQQITPASEQLVLHNAIQQDIVDVLIKEAQAISFAAQKLPETAVQLVLKILNTVGRVVFSGTGKSGLVARKLAATYSSVGIPSFFLHPGDALHGDLGMVRSEDLFIALSKSATGSELEQIFSILKGQGNKTSLICCGDGNLTQLAGLVIKLPFQGEACFMNLAPTSSSTLMIAFGDAIALAVSKKKGFGHNDFARSHPSGALGKRLTLTVRALMHSTQTLPLLPVDLPFKEVLAEISLRKLGVGLVLDQLGHLSGIITDGDLRRACEQGPVVFDRCAGQIMSTVPKTIEVANLAYDALLIMEKFNITSLVVVDAQKPVGVVHIHDLVKAGLRS
ncbi:KpsF/GutQ family sugar-phosphate isomerase [Candidatus Dependentiae bacterium]|jgi:arabinose-5-phosphate isomerase|nr:KpsF/GutQ family sugar-phosphate isomerase [Candidatus Dependentiae bacterium]